MHFLQISFFLEWLFFLLLQDEHFIINKTNYLVGFMLANQETSSSPLFNQKCLYVFSLLLSTASINILSSLSMRNQKRERSSLRSNPPLRILVKSTISSQSSSLSGGTRRKRGFERLKTIRLLPFFTSAIYLSIFCLNSFKPTIFSMYFKFTLR